MIDELIKSLDLNLKCLNYRVKENIIIFELKSSFAKVPCPYCGVESSKAHSTYQREIQDIPVQNRQTILLINTRKMFCSNPDCYRKTFAEKFDFVDSHGKKTNRLIKKILTTSTKLSSVSASKLLKSDSIKVGKSSICDLLKKNAFHC